MFKTVDENFQNLVHFMQVEVTNKINNNTAWHYEWVKKVKYWHSRSKVGHESGHAAMVQVCLHTRFFCHYIIGCEGEWL